VVYILGIVMYVITEDERSNSIGMMGMVRNTSVCYGEKFMTGGRVVEVV
jgi:hypothetical protein